MPRLARNRRTQYKNVKTAETFNQEVAELNEKHRERLAKLYTEYESVFNNETQQRVSK